MPGFKGITMTITKTISVAALLVLLTTAGPVLAQDPQQELEPQQEQTGADPAGNEQPIQAAAAAEPDIETLEQQSQEAYAAQKWVRYYGANIRLMNQRPYEPIYMKRVIEACALLERRRTAYHYLLQMQKQGLSYDFRETPDAANIRTTELFDYLTDLMLEAGQPAGIAQNVVTMDAHYGVPSALTWDQSRERVLVGTLSQGAIVSLGQDGSQEVLIQADVNNGLWAVTGLHADADNNRLWVSTSAIPEFAQYSPADEGRAALLELDLATLQQINRYNVPMDGYLHDLGTLTVADSGDVYVLDHGTSSVFRKAADGQALEPFVGSAEMDSLSAIAVSSDNRRLYLADLYKGILVVDPIERSFVMMSGPENLNLGRINSLAYGDRKLFMIQSDIQPERLMQLDLDDMGTGATESLPMASAMEQFDGPGLALYKGGFVYYFANLDNGDGEAYQLVKTPLASLENKTEFELDNSPEAVDGD